MLLARLFPAAPPPPKPVLATLTFAPCGHCGEQPAAPAVRLHVAPHAQDLYVTLQPASPLQPEPLNTRQQLGKISQHIKAEMGNVARRGMQYGLMAATLVSAMALMAAPIVGAFFVVPGLVLSAGVPVLFVAGVMLGALVETTARRLRKPRLDVAQVVALERIYLELKARKQAEGKLGPDESQSWHKVNRMLEELSGGFWRALRLLWCDNLRLKHRCGRYEVGSVFAQTRAQLQAEGLLPPAR